MTVNVGRSGGSTHHHRKAAGGALVAKICGEVSGEACWHVEDPLQRVHRGVLQPRGPLYPRAAGRWRVGRCVLTPSAQIIVPLMPSVWRVGWQQGDPSGVASVGIVGVVLPCPARACRRSAGEGYRPEQVVFAAAPNAFQ